MQLLVGRRRSKSSEADRRPRRHYICDECIDLCNDIIAEERDEVHRAELRRPPQAARDLRLPQRSTSWARSSAKKHLVCRGLQPLQARSPGRPAGWPRTASSLSKSNILLLGPTGCGKTLLAQDAGPTCRNVPFSIADATALTEAGYVGEDVENILLHLIQAADFDIPKAERGIVYIDEIDKDRPEEREPLHHPRRVGFEGVQQALLKILEGTNRLGAATGRAQAPAHQEFIQIDTTNVLFICGGAFAGLDKLIESRIGKRGIGFRAEVHLQATAMTVARSCVTCCSEDLIKFGLDPRVHRAPARGERGVAVVLGRAGADPRRAEERVDEAARAASALRQRGARVHARRPRGGGQSRRCCAGRVPGRLAPPSSKRCCWK